MQVNINFYKTSDLPVMVNDCTISDCQSMMKLAGHLRPSNDWLLDGCTDQIEVLSCFLAMAEVGCWACDKQSREMITTLKLIKRDSS